MSRLTRRHNNLRKAQARFEKISRRGKQFQLQFDRQQNNRGRYKTSVSIVRGEKQHHGNIALKKQNTGLKRLRMIFSKLKISNRTSGKFSVS